MVLDGDKHQRRSIRLRTYDYSRGGAYFVTMVTHERKCLFGDVVNGRTILSVFGEILADEWQRSADIRENMEFDVFVVMPNHFHGIVHIIGGRSDRDNVIGGGRGDQRVPAKVPWVRLLGVLSRPLPDGSMKCAARPACRSGNETTMNTLSGTMLR